MAAVAVASDRLYSAAVCHRGATRRAAAAARRDIPQEERRTEERKVRLSCLVLSNFYSGFSTIAENFFL